MIVLFSTDLWVDKTVSYTSFNQPVLVGRLITRLIITECTECTCILTLYMEITQGCEGMFLIPSVTTGHLGLKDKAIAKPSNFLLYLPINERSVRYSVR